MSCYDLRKQQFDDIFDTIYNDTLQCRILKNTSKFRNAQSTGPLKCGIAGDFVENVSYLFNLQVSLNNSHDILAVKTH